MNIESKIIYATLGSFITLVCVFTFKLVFISDTLIPATTKSAEIHQECPTSFTDLENDEFIEEVYSDKQVSEVNIAPKNNDLFEKTTKYCDDLCVNNLINELTTNNDEDIIISSEQANLISSTLLENPNKLAEIENKLSSLKDQNSRDSILYIFSRLPEEKIQEITNTLSSSQNKRDRLDALSLLQSTAQTNVYAQTEIKQIISHENDPEILLKAIKVSYSLAPDNIDSTTQNRLSNLIESGSNERIRSAALITKTKLSKDYNQLQTDIQSALISQSKRFTQAGLQALDSVLNKQKREPNQGNWRRNTEIRKNVESIANNSSLAPSTRIEALNLIRRHYINN